MNAELKEKLVDLLAEEWDSGWVHGADDYGGPCGDASTCPKDENTKRIARQKLEALLKRSSCSESLRVENVLNWMRSAQNVGGEDALVRAKDVEKRLTE